MQHVHIEVCMFLCVCTDTALFHVHLKVQICFVFMEGGASKLSECKRRMIMAYEVSDLELMSAMVGKVITGG